MKRWMGRLFAGMLLAAICATGVFAAGGYGGWNGCGACLAGAMGRAAVGGRGYP